MNTENNAALLVAPKLKAGDATDRAQTDFALDNAGKHCHAVAPLIQNPLSSGFDVLATKNGQNYLTYQGKLVYFPQARVQGELVWELNQRVYQKKLSVVDDFANLLAYNLQSQPVPFCHQACYAYKGNCYLYLNDHTWYHCEPVLIDQEKTAAGGLQCQNLLFTARQEQSRSCREMNKFLNNCFVKDLQASTKMARFTKFLFHKSGLKNRPLERV